MAVGSYDSPTFLGQKDKYLVGLTLPQLMVGLGVGFLWFLLSLMLPYGMLVKLCMILPCTILSLVLLFARVWGLSIPMFVLLSLQRSMVKPMYEEFKELVLLGAPEWVEEQQKKAGRKGLRARLRRKAAVMNDPDVEARKAEMKAEVDRQVTEGAGVVEEWVRDGVSGFLKGR